MKGKGSSGGETIIAEGVKVEGDFTSKGNVTIEGHVSGNVSTAGNMFIGENAQIDADVSAANAVVAGAVKGNVRVDERLELTATSRVTGDLEARVLQVAAGSAVNGKVSMPDVTPVAKEEVQDVEREPEVA